MSEEFKRHSVYAGIARDALFDPENERMILRVSQDVDPVLAAVARDRDTLRNNSRVGKKIGTLPAVVVEDLINRGIFYDPDAFDKWWNSFEAGPWKTWDGRV